MVALVRGSGGRVGLVSQVFKAFLEIFQSPVLTRKRVRFAYAVAVTTDLHQFLRGPFGWAFADELLDVTAMIPIWRHLGSHALSLRTYSLNSMTGADRLVTWKRSLA